MRSGVASEFQLNSAMCLIAMCPNLAARPRPADTRPARPHSAGTGKAAAPFARAAAIGAAAGRTRGRRSGPALPGAPRRPHGRCPGRPALARLGGGCYATQASAWYEAVQTPSHEERPEQ
ncbi:hypothetical protein GCM10009605_04450 [Nocardiopsis composta]